MAIEKGIFGKLGKNSDVEFFVLKNKKGVKAKLISFGATLVSLEIPDKNGKFADIVTGYDDLAGYMKDTYYFGCAVGRFANRIANAKFVLDGIEYKLAANAGKHHLHGGVVGFNKVLWRSESFEKDGNSGIVFKYLSPDGQEGYPGNLNAVVTYVLTDDNELKISYEATTDKKTIINLTNHSYFNLAGHNGDDVLSHQIKINADTITAVDDSYIPTGQIMKVEGTKFDLTESKKIGENIGKLGIGYDCNYILNKPKQAELSFAAKVTEPQSGRVMEVFTTESAIQFYTGNFLNGVIGKAGAIYKKHSSFCLETQHYPDSPNHPQFPSVILEPKQVYRHFTVYKFSVV